MSGYSSLWRRDSAASPNATMASITATVTMGRLIEKSEINMGAPSAGGGSGRGDARRAAGADAAGRADEHRVAAREPAEDLDGAAVRVARAGRDGDRREAPRREPQHRRPRLGAAHRGGGDDEHAPLGRRDAPLREQPR